MSATGPNDAPSDVMGVLPRVSAQITISTGDVAMSTKFTCGIARRVIPQSNGTIYLQLSGDASPISYVAVAGQPIDGEVTVVGGSTTGSTSGMVVNLQL